MPPKNVALSIPSFAAYSAAPPRKRSEKFPPCFRFQLLTINCRLRTATPDCQL